MSDLRDECERLCEGTRWRVYNLYNMDEAGLELVLHDARNEQYCVFKGVGGERRWQDEVRRHVLLTHEQFMAHMELDRLLETQGAVDLDTPYGRDLKRRMQGRHLRAVE